MLEVSVRSLLDFWSPALLCREQSAKVATFLEESSATTSYSRVGGCKSWCDARISNGDKVYGWSSCKDCGGCATQAPTPRPPRTKCAALPAPAHKLPKDVIPSLGVSWKLQTPCEEKSLSVSQCSGRPTVLTKCAHLAFPQTCPRTHTDLLFAGAPKTATQRLLLSR